MYAEFIDHATRDQIELILNFLKSEIESSYWSVLGDSFDVSAIMTGLGNDRAGNDRGGERGEDGGMIVEGEEELGDREREGEVERGRGPTQKLAYRPDSMRLKVALRCLNLLQRNMPGLLISLCSLCS